MSSVFIKALRLRNVIFDNTSVSLFSPNAFYENTVIQYFEVSHSTFATLESHSIASGISRLHWADSTFQLLQTNSLSAHVASATVERSHFATLHSHAISLHDWTQLSLLDNTFSIVKAAGLDLTHHNPPSNPSSPCLLSGNVWDEVEQDFIVTGTTNNPLLVQVRNNTFLQQCDCGETIATLVSLEGSKSWFHDQLVNNSVCAVSEKAAVCLLSVQKSEQEEYIGDEDSDSSVNPNVLIVRKNVSDSGFFLPFANLSTLCSDQVYMCMNHIEDVTNVVVSPQLPNRLQILAIFIGSLAVFIVLSLLITMCVFLCRGGGSSGRGQKAHMLDASISDSTKETSMPSSSSGGHGGRTLMRNGSTSDMLRKSTSTHGDMMNDYGDMVYRMMSSSSSGGAGGSSSTARRRSALLLEDVEMEDKGVQTMPTELSTDVLEGLREKLSGTESFWDAKETIDHLYDLIQVKEKNRLLSSPPDVTISCEKSSGPADEGVNNASTNTNSQTPVGVRYAQIRPKQKGAAVCEYGDPSDSTTHIYSELTPHQRGEDRLPPAVPNNVHMRFPPVCDYTEPKDAQSHVYAELFAGAIMPPGPENAVRIPVQNANNATFSSFGNGNRHRGRMTSSATNTAGPPQGRSFFPKTPIVHSQSLSGPFYEEEENEGMRVSRVSSSNGGNGATPFNISNNSSSRYRPLPSPPKK